MLISKEKKKEDVIKIEKNIDGLVMYKGWMKGHWQKRFRRRMWVVMLEGEDLGEHFLTKLGKF
jgi:hypothetical protein